jgi:hypothetical protein
MSYSIAIMTNVKCKHKRKSPLASYNERVLSGKNDDRLRERERESIDAYIHIIVLRAERLIFKLSCILLLVKTEVQCHSLDSLLIIILVFNYVTQEREIETRKK